MSDPLDRLDWTTEPPTEPGVYLMRDVGGGELSDRKETWEDALGG